MKHKVICEMHNDACAHGYKTRDEVYCVTCCHGAEYHTIMMDRISKFIFKLLGLKSCTVGNWCECTHFVPSDNLKFLEELDEINR
jgi:hypothetical protein